MNVLATGATGQYANHVVTALVAPGIYVRGVVHDPATADEARGRRDRKRWRWM